MICYDANPAILGYRELDDLFRVAKFSSLGGYPIFYVTGDSGVLCPGCVEENLEMCADVTHDADPQWSVAGHDVNWEDQSLHCDHCSERIESAYGEE
ncbi:MAG: hypothetical protein P1V36_01670 [Planctomycetota bacterium]|nr:hypothetical protein [Planctomycetota bacterium]